MRKLLIALLTLISSFSFVFTACKNEDTSTNNGNSPNINSSTDSSSSPNEEIQHFSLTTNIESSTIKGTIIQFSVPYTTYSYSFITSFNIPANYKWELHYDKSCLPNLNIVSKTADLNAGENVLYALFVNKNNADEIYLYEIHIYKQYRSAVGTYKGAFGETLIIYSNGTFFYSEYEVEGRWTQSEDNITYTFWGNVKEEYVFDDGVSFEGVYYELIENK